jgi:hypothetical protein
MWVDAILAPSAFKCFRLAPSDNGRGILGGKRAEIHNLGCEGSCGVSGKKGVNGETLGA